MLIEALGLGDDPTQWHWDVAKKLRTRSVPSSHGLDRVPAREGDAGLMTDSHVRELASAHQRFIDAMWAQFSVDPSKPLDGERETITVEQAASFWPALTLTIEVPYWRWTADHYHEQMQHALSVMYLGSYGGEHFEEDPLTIRQANAVVRIFSRWMDAHDVRLEVPNGYDFLKRSDDGGYEWCEHCGAIHDDEVRSEAASCERGTECPLRQNFHEDEFEEDDAEREREPNRSLPLLDSNVGETNG